MKWLLAGCLACAPCMTAVLIGNAAAQEPASDIRPDITSNISDQDLLGYLGNMLIEARLDADVTGDGTADVVYVASNAHERLVGVIAGAARSTPLGRLAIGEGRLPPSPQALVALGFQDGALTVDDLTGDDTLAGGRLAGGRLASGTQAGGMLTAASYTFRYEPPSRRMRLVEIGAERYSPTLHTSALRLRWNLLTGRRVVEQATVEPLDIGERVYIYGPEQSANRLSPPLYMADTPLPDALLGHAATADARVVTDSAARTAGPSLPAP